MNIHVRTIYNIFLNKTHAVLNASVDGNKVILEYDYDTANHNQRPGEFTHRGIRTIDMTYDGSRLSGFEYLGKYNSNGELMTRYGL